MESGVLRATERNRSTNGKGLLSGSGGDGESAHIEGSLKSLPLRIDGSGAATGLGDDLGNEEGAIGEFSASSLHCQPGVERSGFRKINFMGLERLTS